MRQVDASLTAYSEKGNAVMAQGTEAHSLMDRAKQQAFTKLDSQRERAATGLGSMVDALRESGRQLEGQSSTMASYVNGAASQLEQFSGGIRDRDVSQMVRDVEQFARKQPTLFLGGAFVLGIAAARFLKSSSAETSTGVNGAPGGTTPRSSPYATPEPWPDDSIADTVGGQLPPATSSTAAAVRASDAPDSGSASTNPQTYRG